MTAQINLLNKVASVVASDSAATITSTSKIMNSADKIFSLSPSIPIAILNSNSSAFTDIPWSKIFGIYAKEMNGTELPRVKDYAAKLIKVIESNDFLTSYYRHLSFYTNWCSGIVSTVIKEYIRLNKDATKLREFLASQIDSYKTTNSFVEPEHFPIIEDIIKQYLNTSSSLQVNSDAKFISEFKSELQLLLFTAFTKAIYGENLSKIVITGFGKDEFFPSTYILDIQGIYDGHVRYVAKNPYKIDTYYSGYTKSSWILRFAQYEGAALFLEGISPDLQRYIYKNMEAVGNILTEFISNNKVLANLSDEEKTNLKTDTQRFFTQVNRDIQKDISSYQSKNYTSPIDKMVSLMNIDEMIQLSETLVNLTSLKLQFAINKSETVGGPIDVAVLTKERGFEWANKKAHFQKTES